jgi:hypothetical protein
MSARPHLATRFLFFCCIAWLIACPGLGQAVCVDYTTYLHWIGSCDLTTWPADMSVAGGYAYCPYYGQLTVVDVQPPAMPRVVFSANRGASGVDAYGGLLYAAGADPDFKVFSLSLPYDPWLVASLTLPGDSYEVAVDGGVAYVSAEQALHLIDVSDPMNPTLITTLPLPNNVMKAIIRNGYAYLSSNGTGLFVANVTDPLHPAIVGTYSWTQPLGRPAMSWPYVFLAAVDSGVQIIDVSNPASPTLVGSIPTYPLEGSVYAVSVIGQHLYAHCLTVDGDSADEVFDISNPLSAVATGGIAPGGKVVDAGGFACVAAPMALRTLSIGNPASPPVIGGVSVGRNLTDDLAAVAPYVYVAASDAGLKVVDVTDPAHPAVVGTCDTPGTAQAIVVQATLAYIADGASGLRIIDVSSPSHPVSAGTLDTYEAQDLVISGAYAYIADGWGAFKIVRIDNPTSPTLVGTLGGIPYAHAVDLVGGYVIASDLYDGLVCTINVTNPAAPSIVATLYENGIQDFAVHGSTVYMISLNDGLRVYDYGDPLHPHLTRTIALPSYPAALSLSGGTLYVTGGEMGVLAFDVTTPANPVLRGCLDMPGKSGRLDVEGEFVYVCAQYAGMRIFPAHCVAADAPEVDAEAAVLRPTWAPNPCSGPTNLRYVLPAASSVEVAIFDASGRRVRTVTDGWRDAGAHVESWDGRDDAGLAVASGVYRARIRQGSVVTTGPVVVVR